MIRKYDTKLWQKNMTQNYDKKLCHEIMTIKGDLVYITQKWVTYRDTEVSKNLMQIVYFFTNIVLFSIVLYVVIALPTLR